MSVLAEMSDKVDEDVLYVELGSNGFDASLRRQLIELRDEQLRGRSRSIVFALMRMGIGTTVVRDI